MPEPTKKMGAQWKYERGEGRTKHCWNKPYAGFVPGRRGQVGKCANTITDDIAQDLLRDGFPLDDGGDWPEKLVNVYQGCVYMAVPTRPGQSYHGYPYRGRLPMSILAKLECRAGESGYQQEFKRWKKKYLIT